MKSRNRGRRKGKKIELKDIEFGVIALFVPLILILISEFIYLGSFTKTFTWLYENLVSLKYSYLLVFAIINIFLFINCGRLYLIWTSFISLVVFIVSLISKIKLNLRGEPLTPIDLKLKSEAANIVKVLDFKVYIPFILLTLLFLISIYLIAKKIKMKTDRNLRIAFAAMSVVIIITSSFISVDHISALGVNVPADTNWNYEKNGIVLASLLDSKFLNIPSPKDYSQEKMDSIYNKDKLVGKDIENNNLKDGIKPNVIFVMSESFWDPTFAKNLKLNEDAIPNYRMISKEGITGSIRVPGIGGGTANTESEILTGLTKNFIEDLKFPYNPYNNYINRPINSLGNIFRNDGYTSTAVHTYQSWFYKRDDVYKNLGFNRFISMETIQEEPKMFGKFIDDSEINKLILDEMKKTSGSDFIYAVTMQSHGPYEDSKIKDKTIRVENKVSDNSKKILENYLNTIKEADNNLGALISEIKKLDEPTIVVFFGDHIPPLGSDVYTELNFDLKSDNARNTPLLIWSNYEKLEGSKDMDANFLGSYILNLIGNKNDAYMNSLYSLYQTTPHINGETNKSSYKDFIYLQYDIMHGNQYFYKDAGNPIVDKNYLLGYPMEINNASFENKGDKCQIDVTGDGVTFMSKVYVNGDEAETKFINKNKVIATVSKDKIENKESVNITVELYDSRGTLLKKSNTLNYKSSDIK